MKNHITIICLSTITIAGMMYDHVFLAALLWIGYAIYKDI